MQGKLLDLQGKDTEIAQLEYKRSSLPAIETKSELEVSFARARDQHIAAEVILSDLEREALKSEGDVDVVRQRVAKDQEMLDSGAVNDPKQLLNLQHELESLARRQSDLEDLELEAKNALRGHKPRSRCLQGRRLSSQSSSKTLPQHLTQNSRI